MGREAARGEVRQPPRPRLSPAGEDVRGQQVRGGLHPPLQVREVRREDVRQVWITSSDSSHDQWD